MRDVHDCIHLAAYSRIMDRHYRFCLGSYSGFYLRFVYVQRVRPDVDEDWHSAPQDEGVCRGDERIGRHDDLVSWFYISQNCRHLQSCGAGMGKERLFTSYILFKPYMAPLG